MFGLWLKKAVSDIAQLNLEYCTLPNRIYDPKQQQCLIQVIAAGVNVSDALASVGYFKQAVFPRIPGRDFAGLVVDGPASWLGKRVWGSGGAVGIESDGTHAEYIVLPTTALAVIPDCLDFVTAAAQPLPYVTAYYSLVDCALIRGEGSVLVLGAMGSVGRAAMSICAWKNCHAIAAVRGEDAVAEAISLWGKECVVNIEENSEHLAALILAANQGNSVDVILNSMGNCYWETFMKVLAPFGRMVMLAAREGFREVALDLFALYRANQSIMGVNTLLFDFVANVRVLNELSFAFDHHALTPLPTRASTLYDPMHANEAYQSLMRPGVGKARTVICFSRIHHDKYVS